MQLVVIAEKTLQWGQIKAGVSQGAVLRLLLFLIYINDISDNIHSPMTLFADDTFLYITFGLVYNSVIEQWAYK